jgi:predicted flap endonuclease-1-like 5' DNA nuclease
MTLLFKIIRAAHANGTHHKLALDALRDLEHEQADGWRKVFLRHADSFMEGAKAPDTVFKDFKNHVLHVGDNYWGGAPERVQHWYAVFVRELKASNWPEAVYAAGVLAHYYCDPIHPFHTAQSEAENNIHRAVEWSINRSYDDLRVIGEAHFWGERPEPADGQDWLADFVCRGAEKSHGYYEYLIAHYNLQKGVVDPPAGLDDNARRILAELIMYAAGGYAAILDRAIAEAAVAPPEVNLTLDTVMAAIKIPAKWVLKKLTDAEDRKIVEAMYDELMETGKVEANLPEDDRVVRALHAKEVLGAREADRVKGRAAQVATLVPQKPALRIIGGSAEPVRKDTPATHASPVRSSVPSVAPPMVEPQRPLDAGAGALAATAAAAQAVMSARVEEPRSDGRAATEAASLDEAAEKMRAALDRLGEDEKPARSAEARLAPEDDIVDAPSIGPKTAERLIDVGVVTVKDLLDADPGVLSEMLDTRHITARTIRDWQYQARLVIDIPGINGTDAQLLVGAGYSGAAKVRDASGDDLYKAVTEFAKSSEGQRILRFGKAPDKERVARWLELARGAVAKAA